MQVWALILDSFRHTRDRKIFWVMLGISVLIAVAMSLISFDRSGVTLFFRWHFDAPEYRAGTEAQRSLVITILTLQLIGNYIGFAGVLLGLVATAGILPDLMRPGAIDVVLAKPLSRAKLFLGKYLGSMSFVLVQSAFFVTLTFLVAGIRWKQWLLPYFWSIPLSVILFSYIYAFVALFGVVFRTTLTPLLLGLLCWFGCFAVQAVSPGIQMISSLTERKALVTYADAAQWAVPRTRDVPIIAARLIDPEIAEKTLGRATFDEAPVEEREFMQRSVEVSKKVMVFPMAASLASSLGIEAVILILAMWRFSRRDF